MKKQLRPWMIAHADSGLLLRKGESDCACPSGPGEYQKAALPGAADLRCVTTPVIPVDANHTALLAARTGGLAILNDDALQLWRAFDRPGTPSTVLDRFRAAVDPAIASTLIERFWDLGLLDTRQPFRPPDNDSMLIVWLQLTNACNLRCAYCYVAKSQEYMDEPTGQQAIRAVFRAALRSELKQIKIKYAGGEPLLRFNHLLTLHDLARQQADQLQIALEGVVLTNGVLLKAHHVDAFAARGLKIMISLDGIGPVHDQQRYLRNGQGSFAAVQRAVELAVMRGLVPQISITVTGQNAAYLPETVNWILDHDLPFSINFYRAIDGRGLPAVSTVEQAVIDGMRATLEVIAQRMPPYPLLSCLTDRADFSYPHQYPCAAGRNYLVIGPRGEIARCHMQPDQPVTSINAVNPLAEIRANPAPLDNIAVDEKEFCASCEWKYVCAGGCPLETYRAAGRYDTKSPNCNILKALFPDIVRLEALRLMSLARRE